MKLPPPTLSIKGKSRGRKKGATNYKKIDAKTRENQYGVVFTVEEQKELRKLVASTNKKGKRLEKQHRELVVMRYGKPELDAEGNTLNLHDTKGRLIKDDGRAWFRRANFSTDMHQFKTRKDLEKHMARLRSFTSRGWEKEKQQLMMDNYFTALENVFNPSQVEALIEHIKTIPHQKCYEILMGDDYADFSYVYQGDGKDEARLINICRAWGMNVFE